MARNPHPLKGFIDWRGAIHECTPFGFVIGFIMPLQFKMSGCSVLLSNELRVVTMVTG
jgi:hypothetical protein